MVKKVKVTLSLREDLVRKAKSKLALEGRTLSDAVEEFLTTCDEIDFLDRLCEALGVEKMFYTTSEVIANRPRGFRAEKVLREARSEREKRISGH